MLPAIEAAHSLDEPVHVITCDYLPDNIAHKYSDEYINVSITDKEAVLAVAKEKNIDGILSFACDPGVVTAAYVAQKLGIPAPAPYESAVILQNKGLFRDFLANNGFNVPWHRNYETEEVACEDLINIDFPAVVKPVDLSGSKGVTKVNNIEEYSLAVKNAFSQSRCKQIIVEQYIEPKYRQSGSDSFVQNGKLVFATFDGQFYDLKSANPFTPSAMCYPSNMPEAQLAELKTELQRLISLLQIDTTILNIECRVGTDDKTYIMEVTPRAGGNRVPELVGMATGQDIIRNSVLGALGLPMDEFSEPLYDGSYARVILHSYVSGNFEEISIDSEIKDYLVEEDLFVDKGSLVGEFYGASDSLGLLIFKFPNIELAEKYLKNIDSLVHVVVREM